MDVCALKDNDKQLVIIISEKGDGFVGSITNVNFWDKDVPVSVIYPQGGACRAPHQDALISWNDFTSAAMNDVSAAIPSVCDGQLNTLIKNST